MVETTENLANALLQPFQSLAPVQEPRNLLTILWDPDRPNHPAPTQAAIESLLYGETNSVEDYFLENSNGQFTINNAGIFGWYDADKPADHYWGPVDVGDTDGDGWISGHVEKWAEAIRKADQDFNFAAYDSNSDGYLHPHELGVLIVIPQNNSDGFVRSVVGSQVPPEPLVVDGVTVPIMAEAYIGNPPHLGLVAHELSHLLLDHADMYFGFNTPFAAGEYSLMDQHWKAPHLDPFAKLKFGWVEPNIVTESGEYDITDVETSNEIWVLMDPEKGTDEYFIIENRQPGNTYDSQLSDSGLAIWHVIEDPAIYGSEIPPTPPGVNQDSWEASWSTIPAGDWGRRAIRSIKPVWNTFTNTQALWDGSDPATGYDLLSSNSDPQKATLQWADGTPSGFEIRDISSSADTMQVYIETPGFFSDFFTVTNTNDSGSGSLRQAILNANALPGLNTITFEGSVFSDTTPDTIILTSEQLHITDDLTIEGLGADQLTISGNNASRVFLVDDGDNSNAINVEIQGVTISDGNPSNSAQFRNQGGGIFNKENLTITNSTIRNNTALFNAAGIWHDQNQLTIENSTIKDNTAGNFGGGIVAGANLLVTNSTISDNTAGNDGGGIYFTEPSGGVTVLTINNSTITANTTSGDGGGIFISSGNLSVNNSTITANTTSGNGGGIFNSGGLLFNDLSINNSIIAGNTDSSPAENNPDVSGDFDSTSYNLIGDGTGSTSFTDGVDGNQVGTSSNPIDPLLGPLQNNGGLTATHALLENSPAIEAGDPNFAPPPEFDQRGDAFPRVFDSDEDGTAIVDIGAVELIPDDNYEPNNTLETAYDITGDEQTWLEDIDGLGVANNEDWYKIETGSGFENLMVNLQFTHADGDLDLILHDSNGIEIARSTSVTDDEQINIPAPEGSYYLEVYPYSSSDAGNTYDLWWDDVADLDDDNDDNYEPNNTLETAYDITGEEQTWLEDIDGLGVANNPDWYKIETGSGFENLEIYLQFTHADGDIDLALYDASGSVITSSTSVTDNEQINVAAPAGIYYLEVYPLSGAQNAGNTYDLWWDDVATL